MDKKDLKFYEAPATEVVELNVEGFLCWQAPTLTIRLMIQRRKTPEEE